MNGVVLPAVYNNAISLTCSINASDVSLFFYEHEKKGNKISGFFQVSFSMPLQLILPNGTGQVIADVEILWTAGENTRGEMIYHSIGNFTAVSGKKSCIMSSMILL